MNFTESPSSCKEKPDQLFVIKPMSDSVFEQSLELKTEFKDSKHLRFHVDENEAEHTLVYSYYKSTLLRFVQKYPKLPLAAKKSILWQIGQALQELHSKNWIHLDTKPDNVVLNWDVDENGEIKVGDVVLGDLDCALKLIGDKLLNFRIGNVMWRSPEGQAGRGIGKHSEVFSFGLMCLYTITGVETLRFDFEQYKAGGTEPEHVVFYNLLSMFGPVPQELIDHIDDPWWQELATTLAKVVAQQGEDERLATCDDSTLPNLDTETKRLILRMTNLDPRKRATIDEILEDPWWKCI